MRLLAVAAAIVVIAMPTAAHAAPAADIELSVPPSLVMSTGGYRAFPLFGDITGSPARVHLAIRASGQVRLNSSSTPGGQCTGSGNVECVLRPPFSGSQLSWVVVEAVAGAPAGATGRIDVTARADGGPTRTASTSIRIVESVRLSPDEAGVTAEQGVTTLIRPSIRNAGQVPVQGVVLKIYLAQLMGDPIPGNCRFDGRLVCFFEQTLEPETTYLPSGDLPIRMPDDAARNSIGGLAMTWFTPAEWAEQPPSTGAPGTAPPISLEGAEPATPRDQANDRGGPAGSSLYLTVAGEADTGIEAVAPASVRARVGETVRVRVGWRNTGPGTLYRTLFYDTEVVTRVFLPSVGLTIVDAGGCTHGKPEDQGGYELELYCGRGPEVVRAGEGKYWDIAFKYDRRGRGGDALVSQNHEANGGPQADGSGPDLAGFRITVVGGGATGGGSGGGGPTLPITGPDGGLFALAGSLMVLTGFVLVRIGRRKVVHS